MRSAAEKERRIIDDREKTKLFEWTPLVGLGPLKFGLAVEPYVKQGTLVPFEFDVGFKDATGWDHYSYAADDNDDDTLVSVESGRIVSIGCYRHCVLRGCSLIGSDYETVKELIGSEPVGDPDVEEVGDQMQEVYDFGEAGALIWVLDGVVVSIDCDDRNA